MKKNELVKKEGGVKPNGEIKSLAMTLETESQKHKLLEDYIIKQLKKDVDYGVIAMERNGKKFVSKPCLFKPGAEKVVNRTKTIAKFRRDDETWEMLGKQPGMICYICELYNGDKIIGEGRGSASMLESKFKNNPNTAIKIAEKRAKIDAVLATFALSARFTQDLEDMQGNGNLPENTPKTVHFPQNSTKPRKAPEKPENKGKSTFIVNKKAKTRDEYIEILVYNCKKHGISMSRMVEESGVGKNFEDMSDAEVKTVGELTFKTIKEHIAAEK